MHRKARANFMQPHFARFFVSLWRLPCFLSRVVSHQVGKIAIWRRVPERILKRARMSEPLSGEDV
jgi:hypothetical protein